MSKREFTRWFEKKLRKEVRDSSIKKGDKICVVNTKDNNYFVLNDFLRNRIGLPLEFSSKGRGVYPSSIEEVGRDLLNMFFKGDDKNNKKLHNTKEKGEAIHLLTSFTQEEIDREASYLGFNGKSRKNDEIINMINRLDEKFKNIKSGLANSSKTIMKAVEKRQE